MTVLSAKERAKRRLVWLESPAPAQAQFRADVESLTKAIGAERAKEAAWVSLMRRRAWRRRGGDAKPCERCGCSVLWRRERGGSVAVDGNARAHACGEEKR